MSSALSRGEIAFVCGGIAADVRADGRARLDWRPFTLQTQLFAQTNGSARHSPLPFLPSLSVPANRATCLQD